MLRIEGIEVLAINQNSENECLICSTFMNSKSHWCNVAVRMTSSINWLINVTSVVFFYRFLQPLRTDAILSCNIKQ